MRIESSSHSFTQTSFWFLTFEISFLFSYPPPVLGAIGRATVHSALSGPVSVYTCCDRIFTSRGFPFPLKSVLCEEEGVTSSSPVIHVSSDSRKERRWPCFPVNMLKTGPPGR